MHVRGVTDFLAGLLFAGFGVLGLYLGRDYPIGSAMRMGPGYFPAVLSGLLLALGALAMLRGLAIRGDPPHSFATLLTILASVGIFALTVERVGIVIAVVLVTVVSSLASGTWRWKEQLVLNAVMVALAVGLFAKGLELPFKIFPG
jgi:putative tricarboxylic transport membrane protein